MIKRLALPWVRLLGAALLGGLVLAAPRASAAGFLSGVRLCVHSLLPGLFPFFVVCALRPVLPAPRLLHGVQKMTGLQSEAAASALLLSWVGGYAICAGLTADLRRQNAISKRDATLLMLLGCCSGPGFVVVCLGGLLLGNTAVGLALYVLQLAANLLVAALLLPLLPPPEPCTPTAPIATPKALPQAIGEAVGNSLAVCGCVVLYSQLAAVLQSVPGLAGLPGAALHAVLELSGGCAALAAQGGAVALYGCCAALSLLGASVFTQISLLLGGCVPLRLLAFSRVLHCGLFLLLVRLGVRFVPGAVTVSAALGGRVIPMLRLPPDAAAVGVVFLCAALYKARQSIYNRVE